MHDSRRSVGGDGELILVIERQVDFEQPKANALAALCESAVEFGLTPHEVFEAVMTTPDRLPEDVRSHYLDELSGGLARRLLEKQRV
jgi:hypothetical protein